ncbi:MAG: MlaD family protein [Flavobacteriales bacterium]
MRFSKEIKIGITALVAIAAIIWGVNFLKGESLFGDNRKFYVIYEEVGGLVPASPVTLHGQKIGQVRNTGIILKGEHSGKIICEFVIDYEGLAIPRDSRAKFYSVDVLGTKGISIELGKSAEAAQPGDTLISAKSPSLQESVDAQIAPLKKKAEELIGSIDSMVTIVSGVLGQNTGELDASFKSIRRAILKFESTANNLDDFIATERFRLSSIFAKVDKISGTLASNSGKMDSTISNLTKISTTLANSDIAGTIGKIKTSVDLFANILADVDSGNGSLGKLVNTDSLYTKLMGVHDEIEALIQNIKDHPYRYLHFSVFGKREKGIKLDSRDEKKLKELLKNTPPKTTPTNGN